MNISPHHQRPTKYPWPGMASALMVVFALLMALLIGFFIIDPFSNRSADGDPAAMQVTVAQGS